MNNTLKLSRVQVCHLLNARLSICVATVYRLKAICNAWAVLGAPHIVLMSSCAAVADLT